MRICGVELFRMYTRCNVVRNLRANQGQSIVRFCEREGAILNRQYKSMGGINEYFKRRAPKPWFWRPCYFLRMFQIVEGRDIGLVGANGEENRLYEYYHRQAFMPDEGKIEG